MSGKEGKSEGSRHYGESTYVRLPSSRSAWPNYKVSTRAVHGRAAVVKDSLSMISGSEFSVSKEESDRIEKFLFIQLVKQNKAVFISILPVFFLLTPLSCYCSGSSRPEQYEESGASSLLW